MAIIHEQALLLLREHVNADVLIKHALATEAVMRALAERLGRDPDRWGITGLLHDLDFEQTKDCPERHALVAEPWLREAGCDEEMIQAIKAHNAEALGIDRRSEMDLALTAAETMTGMVVTTALVYPDKKLASVKAKSITKRMKEKSFAQGVNRDHIMLCEKIGIPMPDFAELSLNAMKNIAEPLGL
jgi:putative nucleotidyltransferase with HDIG domain